jgi:class 3 adenylate cyclase/CheY-like chemotaxis protein
MRERPLILVVDDVLDNVEIVRMRLEALDYKVITAADGIEALASVAENRPDLVLLDIMMPRLDGIETVKRLKADTSLPFVPVIMLTAKADRSDVIAGLEAGGDDYLTKPVEHAALVARVRAMLRIKALHDTVQQQADELASWNRTLEAKVAAQVEEITRTSRLRRFLAPQLVDVILSSGDEELFRTHRREIVVVFCDLRGFTAFAETAEPEEVTDLLCAYHARIGPVIHTHEGTLDRFTGDGALVFFNDPVPCQDPADRAVAMAREMRASVTELARSWVARGHELGFGIGMAQGYATLGPFGFDGRYDYTAIGTVTNTAARLCGEARDGQILVTRRVVSSLRDSVAHGLVGSMSLKGLSRPTEVFEILD